MPFPHLTTYTPFEDAVTDVLAEDQIHHVIFGGVLQVTTLPASIAGTATAGSTGQVLIDSGATFISSGVVVGQVVYNATDASYAIVKSVDSETQITTTPLKGGTNNVWANADTFTVKTCPKQVILLTAQDGTNAPGTYIRNAANNAWLYLVDSNMVTLAGVQTLTNKILNSSTNYIDADAIHLLFFNNSGGALTKGMAVHINAWNNANGLPEMVKSIATSLANAVVDGVIEDASVADGAIGSIRVIGILDNWNTNAASSGDTMYLSTSVAGGFQTTAPSVGGQYITRIGTIGRQSATLGTANIAISMPEPAGVSGLSWGSAINGATGTGVALTMSNSYAVSGIGQSITIGNTQTNALTGLKIDTGTAAVAHVGLLINAVGASSTQKGISIVMSTTATGVGLEISTLGGNTNASYRQIRLTNDSSSNNNGKGIEIQANNAGSYAGIYWNSIFTGGGSFNASGIEQVLIASGVSGTCAGIRQTTIGGGSNTAIGLYQTTIQNSTGTAIGWKVDNLSTANKTTSLGTAKYFSLNNAQSANLTSGARTHDTSEILHSRTNTATTGTVADSFNLMNLVRTSVQNGAGGTFTQAGSVLRLENIATQTAGTLTDTVSVLTLAQSANSTGLLIDGGSGNFQVSAKGRIAPRVGTEASSATSTPTGDTVDIWTITALAAADAIAAPTGTPINGQKLTIRIKDNGTARALTWNAIYRAIGITLPTTTVISKTLYIGCVYNSADSKWDVLAISQEA